jgi:2'-5' RNA ligase
MSNNLVIAAIPSEDDRVWKISSEEIPHLTLLFLGDADSNPHLEQIMLFVEHAVTMSEHGPFYLDVDRRGVLGPDEADVLFFSQRSWNLKWIKQFRGQLLQNQNIRSAYDSTEQYPEWTPHLTLGYPATPAKPIGDGAFDHPIYSVNFDRIAVWTSDFSGPEFQLEYPDRENELCGPYDMAMSTVGQTTRKPSIEEVLEHHGVNAIVSKNEAREVLGVGAIDDKERNTSKSTKLGAQFVHASVLDDASIKAQIKAKIQSILDDVTGDADQDVYLFGDPLIRAKLQSVLEDFYNTGVDKAMAYSALTEACLEHHGIKGMRWGLRKEKIANDLHQRRLSTEAANRENRPAQNVKVYDSIGATKKAKSTITTKGGEDHPPTEDAIKVAAAQQKLKKSGFHALTNQELRDVQTRLQLEAQVSQLSGKRQTSAGRKFLNDQLLNNPKNQQKVGGFVFKQAVKRAAKAGLAVAA